MLNIRTLFHKKQTGMTLIKLFLQKQSDLGQHCLSRHYWQATDVQSFRTFTVPFPFFTSKMLHIRTSFHKRQTEKTLIRLLHLQKQSDLGQHCLSRLFWQATDVHNFRTFTVLLTFFHKQNVEYKDFIS